MEPGNDFWWATSRITSAHIWLVLLHYEQLTITNQSWTDSELNCRSLARLQEWMQSDSWLGVSSSSSSSWYHHHHNHHHYHHVDIIWFNISVHNYTCSIFLFSTVSLIKRGVEGCNQEVYPGLSVPPPAPPQLLVFLRMVPSICLWPQYFYA